MIITHKKQKKFLEMSPLEKHIHCKDFTPLERYNLLREEMRNLANEQLQQRQEQELQKQIEKAIEEQVIDELEKELKNLFR